MTWELHSTTATRFTECIKAVLKCEAGLSMLEYSMLLMTDHTGEEGVCPPPLAHQVVFSRSRLTHTTKRLEPRGPTEHRPYESDGRGGLVSLTPVGKTLFDEAALVQRDVIRRLFLDGITPEEIDMLTSLFAWVSEHLDSSTLYP